MNTLLLDRTAWDLCIDAYGDIAMCTPPYALAQDAASAVRLFKTDYWYDTEIGIPYFQQVLGKNPPINLMKALMIDAAVTVPGVVSAAVYIASLINGQVSGQVQIKDENSVTTIAGF